MIDVPYNVLACETAWIRLVRRKSLYCLGYLMNYDFCITSAVRALPLSDRLQTEGERRRVVRLLVLDLGSKFMCLN